VKEAAMGEQQNTPARPKGKRLLVVAPELLVQCAQANREIHARIADNPLPDDATVTGVDQVRDDCPCNANAIVFQIESASFDPKEDFREFKSPAFAAILNCPHCGKRLEGE